MIAVCWFSFFSHHFDLVKWVKFGVSRHFPKNAWKEWPKILHANVSWAPSELIRLGSRSVDFLPFGITVRRVKFVVSGHLWENAWKKWPEILHADVSWADYGHALLIFFLLASLRLGERCRIRGLHVLWCTRFLEMIEPLSLTYCHPLCEGK